MSNQGKLFRIVCFITTVTHSLHSITSLNVIFACDNFSLLRYARNTSEQFHFTHNHNKKALSEYRTNKCAISEKSTKLSQEGFLHRSMINY